MEKGSGDDQLNGSTLTALAAKIKNIEGSMITPARRNVVFGNNDTATDYVVPTKMGDNIDSPLHADGRTRKVAFGETMIHEYEKTDPLAENTPIIQPNEAANEIITGDKQETSSSQKPSFASVVNDEASRKVMFRLMESEKPSNEAADVQIPLSEIRKANSRFENSLYGYFLGKRVAFPVVQQYVQNSWKKYGLVKIMMNSKGFFFFKFNSAAGLDGVLENGPWFIRNVPIVLKKWSSNVSLLKEDTHSVPTWIKLFDVPIAAYTEVGLSIIASKLGKPIMLDSYTCTMCTSSWGRMDFARAMIELRADLPLKNSMVVEIPSEDGSDPTLHTIKVEYEWKPPRCDSCKVFGHDESTCPNNVIELKNEQKDSLDEGFQDVKTRNRGKKVQMNQKPKVIYRVKNSAPKPKTNASLSKGSVNTSNSFEALGNAKSDEIKEGMGTQQKMSSSNSKSNVNPSSGKNDGGQYSGGNKDGGNTQQQDPSHFPKWQGYDDEDDDDEDDVHNPSDYDIHSYLDSLDRSKRKK